MYEQLVSPALSEQQRASLSELTKFITAPEKKLRLGVNHEFRESFRANPTPEHELFVPLRIYLQRLTAYQREFAGTLIEPLLKELIGKSQAFIFEFVEQFQKSEGPTSPLKLFGAKPILQGEGFEAYEVESEKAYQLACYSPHEYEYVRGNSSGLSIGSVQGDVYFKVDDGRGLLKPAREHAVYTLYQRLGLENLLAPTHLVVMNGLAVLPADIGESPERRELQRKKQELNTLSTQEVFSHYPRLEQRIAVAQHEYPLRIQGSLVVEGKTLEKFLEEAEQSADAAAIMNQLEPTSFSSHILASLLLLPTDYKSDNLMVDLQNRIIGIDNDACLEAQELCALGDGKTHGVSIKNILYLLPLMQAPIASNIRDKFMKHHPGVLLLNWFLALKDKQTSYNNLLDASLLGQENVGQVKRNVEESLGLPLCFVPGWMTGMYERFTKLQQLLKDNPTIKHQALFESIHPYASRYYQGLKKLYPQPLDQLAFAYNKMWNLNTELSNDLESVLAKHPAPGDFELLKSIAEADYQNKAMSLSMDQVIEELVASVDLNTYTPGQQLAWLERVAAVRIFPSKLHDSWYGSELLIRMVKEGARYRVIKTLLERAKADIHTVDESGETVLHAAVRKGGKSALKLFISLGAYLEHQDRYGITPLDLAVEQNNIAAFKLLVDSGAGEKVIAQKTSQFYQRLRPKKKKKLIRYIKKLTEINPKVGWKISLDEIFPTNAKGILKTVTEGERIITEEAWNSLFGQDGSPRKVNAYGVRPVSFVEKNGQRIYVKFFPQLPGTELAVIRLAENLLGYCAPYCELASINGIPVLLTQGVPGDTLYDVLQKDPEKLKELDPESVSKALILAMLINPGDGNLGNYIVSPFTNREGQLKYRLISIDNDQAFMPGVAKSIKTGVFSSSLSLQVKTILYCLDAMQEPVSQKLIQQIQEKDLVLLLASWLSSLKIHHESAKNHFDSGLLKKYQDDKASVIGVSFAPGMIKQLFTKLMRLQIALNKKTPPKHVELLSSLEPVVAHRYGSVLTDSRLSAIEKFKKAEYITEEQALTSSSNALPQLLVSREIPGIGELQAALWGGKFGPDQALQELKLVQEQHTNLKEILEGLGNLKIQDLKALPDILLENLLQAADLAKLPISQEKSLLEAIRYKELTRVFLKNSRVMTGSWLPCFKLECIRELDLSGCENLVNISGGVLGNSPIIMSALTHLKLDGSGVSNIRLGASQLKRLSARNCKQLKVLGLATPQLHRLDIREVPNLNRETIESIFEQFPYVFTYLTPTLAFPKEQCAEYLHQRGSIHLSKLEYEQAVHYLKQAAEQEKFESASCLIELALQGIKAAQKWVIEQAEKGDQHAEYILGQMHGQGKGLTQDDYKAAVWYEKAAEQGHIGAQWNLGSMCAEGSGVEKDNDKAQLWIARADEQVCKWPQGAEILKAIKSENGTKESKDNILDLTTYYGSLSMEQVGMLLQHPCFKQKELIIKRINSSDIRKLTKTLPSSQVQKLDLSGNNMGPTGVQELCKALANSQLHSLNLSDNKMDTAGAQELCKALANSQLYILNLEKNNIGAIGVQNLAQFLPNSQLHTLNLGNNNIGDSGAQDLAQFLPNSQLHILNLWGNNIGATGAQALAKFLPKSQLHTLNLRTNNIGDSGAQALAKALPNSQLHTLCLGENNISATGAQALANFLPKSQLHTLYLGTNNIGDSGAQDLAKALPRSKIRALYIWKNNIGDSGARDLSKALSGSKIQTLQIYGNNISKDILLPFNKL